jgi:hypothetical protein
MTYIVFDTYFRSVIPVNKKQLIKDLLTIKNQYLEDEEYLKPDSNDLKDFADCYGLDDKQLAKHLLTTEMVPLEEELLTEQVNYSTPAGIIEQYQKMYWILESMGLVDLKTQEVYCND